MPNVCYNSLTLNHNDISYLQEIGEQLCLSINIDNDVNFNYDDCDTYNNYKTVKTFFDVLCKHNYHLDIEEVRPMISQINVNKSNYEVNIIFDTAWSPPIEFYNHLKQNKWIVNAVYHIPEDESCGRFTNKHGDEYYEYSSDDKTTYCDIPEEILDFTCLLEDDEEDNEDDEEEDEEENEDDYIQLLKKYKRIMTLSDVCFNKVTFHSEDIRILNDIELRLSENLNNRDYELFNLLFPRPPIEDLFTDETVLGWNEKGWGTKCEPTVISYERIDNNTITFEFQTANTPPLGIYRFYVEEGWNVNALYYENKNGICGRFTNEKDVEVYEYNKDDISSIIKLPNDILEFSKLLENYDEKQ